MKTITLPVFKRPALLAQTIKSLERAKPTGYSLVAVCDFGHDPECFKMLHDIGFLPKHLVVLGTHYGVDHAGKHAIDVALSFGSEINLHVEEDTPVSPDIFDLVNWWSDQIISHRSVLNAFSMSRDRLRPSDVTLHNGFCGFGWACRRQLLTELLPRWIEKHPGWDVSLEKTLREHQIPTVKPILSRVSHIGATGHNYNPALYDQHFAGHVASHGLVRKYFLNT